MTETKQKTKPKKAPVEKAVKTVEAPVIKSGPIDAKQAKKRADMLLKNKEERYVSGVDISGNKYLKDLCSPTFVTDDGMVFHADSEGEALAHAKSKNLKLFEIHYERKS